MRSGRQLKFCQKYNAAFRIFTVFLIFLFVAENVADYTTLIFEGIAGGSIRVLEIVM
jgi:hypothetical protein